jgi:uncharacterized membrane protein YphA (DoxX/SURF4 family)
MPSDPSSTSTSKAMFWAGWVITILPALSLIMSAVFKFMKPPEVLEGFTHLGWPDTLALALGIIELTCTILYLIPTTAVLGAILLTGYLGGAIATHVRIEEGFVAPVIIGILIWLGIYLREPRLRAILPFRS